jgi:glycosyltransferase involved in cell wall biosynthesis
MKILLVHQNFPGQFKHLIQSLLSDKRNQVVAFTMNSYKGPSNLKVVRYEAARGTSKEIHPWVAETETKVIRGEAAFRAAIQLRNEGFEPDLILAHPGWGESLFLKEVWPNAKMVMYCEFHYTPQGSDVGFDLEFPNKDEGDLCRVRMKNVNNLLHFAAVDGGIAPTEWQKSTFPEPFRSMIDVVHDGIDTDAIKPHAKASFKLGDTRLTREDEIITFVNRNLEPYRGYHIFMRSLPDLLSKRPNARVIIVGGDGVSYGAAAPAGKTWKEIYLDEVKDRIDLSRVHFVGHLQYEQFIPLLQVSRVHVYLTYPFVLSWSLLEAMACGCAIVASDTAPLKEAIFDQKTGVLTPFFEPQTLANNVVALLEDKEKREQLGAQARQFAIEHYDLNRVCLPAMLNIIDRYRRS